MVKTLQCRRPGFNPWVGKIAREGNSNPLQYSCLENPMARGAWQARVHGVAKRKTQLNDSHTHTHTHTELYAGSWTRAFSTPIVTRSNGGEVLGEVSKHMKWGC